MVVRISFDVTNWLYSALHHQVRMSLKLKILNPLQRMTIVEIQIFKIVKATKLITSFLVDLEAKRIKVFSFTVRTRAAFSLKCANFWPRLSLRLLILSESGLRSQSSTWLSNCVHKRLICWVICIIKYNISCKHTLTSLCLLKQLFFWVLFVINVPAIYQTELRGVFCQWRSVSFKCILNVAHSLRGFLGKFNPKLVMIKVCFI